MNKDFIEKVKKVKKSIVAIGFNPNEAQITIIGSGFPISDDGKILTCAHVYNSVPKELVSNLKALVMVSEEMDNLEKYSWIPVTLILKNDQTDVAILQIENYKNTLIFPLELGNSDEVEVGQEVYFISFPYAAQLMNEGFGITVNLSKTIISNIKRDGVDPKHFRNWFLVDTINNPGNSGAPLIDLETHKVIGFMSIAFRIQSQVMKNLDIREPMHIGGAKPINLVKELISN